MNTQNTWVLLADCSQVYTVEIASYLNANKSKIKIESVVRTGRELIRQLEKKKPDVLVMDLLLMDIDGIAVLEYIQRNPSRRPDIIIMQTAVTNDQLLQRVLDMGVDYILIKPYEISVLEARIQDLTRQPPPKPQVISMKSVRVSADDIDRLYDVLHHIGVPSNIKGFRYLKEALMIILNNPSTLSALTTYVYPEIAKLYDSKANCVERAIRHAIEKAWSVGRIEVLNQYFGYSIKESKGKPTNGEFLARIVDFLQLERMRY